MICSLHLGSPLLLEAPSDLLEDELHKVSSRHIVQCPRRPDPPDIQDVQTMIAMAVREGL